MGKLVLFSLFCCNMAHRFEHVCLIISDLEGESKEKKFTTSYLQRRKMEKWRQKEFLTTLRMSINCKKSLQQLNCDHYLCHCCERLAVSKNVSHIILL